MTEKKLVPAIVARHHGDPPAKVETLCPFDWNTAADTLQAILQRPFEPKGLMLWNVPDGAQLMIFIGTGAELIASVGPLPARWFTAFESFQQLAAKLDQGLEPPGWGTFNKVYPGVMIRLRFEARRGETLNEKELKKVEAVMWGYSVSL